MISVSQVLKPFRAIAPHSALHAHWLKLHKSLVRFLPKKWRAANTPLLSEIWHSAGARMQRAQAEQQLQQHPELEHTDRANAASRSIGDPHSVRGVHLDLRDDWLAASATPGSAFDARLRQRWAAQTAVCPVWALFHLYIHHVPVNFVPCLTSSWYSFLLCLSFDILIVLFLVLRPV